MLPQRMTKHKHLRLYVEQSEMDTLVGEDMDRYRVALEATGGTVDDIEPIQRFHEAFQGPIDAWVCCCGGWFRDGSVLGKDT